MARHKPKNHVVEIVSDDGRLVRVKRPKRPPEERRGRRKPKLEGIPDVVYLGKRMRDKLGMEYRPSGYPRSIVELFKRERTQFLCQANPQ